MDTWAVRRFSEDFVPLTMPGQGDKNEPKKKYGSYASPLGAGIFLVQPKDITWTWQNYFMKMLCSCAVILFSFQVNTQVNT